MIKAKFSLFSSIFIIITILVITSHIFLSRVVIGLGLTDEDYLGLYIARVYREKMFTSPVYFVNHYNLHNISHDLYIGFLDLLFQDNYDMYLYASIFLKILATLTLFLLILLTTRNKLLAALATFLFGISYPASGALRLYVVGNEYLGVALMNLFFVAYYFCIKKENSWRLLFFASLTATLSFMAAPIRVFPLFIIVLLIELFILFKNKFSRIYPSVLRGSSIAAPGILIMLFSLKETAIGSYSPAGIPDFLKMVAAGNWWLMLNPFWGLGYTFLPIRYTMQLFGVIDTTHFSFSTYLNFLFQKPLILSALVSLLLTFIISKKKLRFFVILMSVNFILNILLYIIFSHNLSSSFNSFHGLYANILANYILSVSITCGIEWFLTGRRNQLVFLTFLAPLISLFFILSQWVFTRDMFIFQEGVHRYFVLPAIGSYLFLACLIVLIYQKAKTTKGVIKLVTSSMAVVFLLYIINVSRDEQYMIFQGRKMQGLDLKIQESMKQQTFNYIPKDKIQENLLFYIKFKSEKLGDANHWENIFNWYDLHMWMALKRSYFTGKAVEGCVATTWDINELRKMTRLQNGIKGFLYDDSGNKMGLCSSLNKKPSVSGKFIPLDNLFAFSIDQYKVIDITKEIRKDYE